MLWWILGGIMLLGLVVASYSLFAFLYPLYLHRKFIDEQVCGILKHEPGRQIPISSSSEEMLRELRYQLKGYNIKVRLYRDPSTGQIFYDKSK